MEGDNVHHPASKKACVILLKGEKSFNIKSCGYINLSDPLNVRLKLPLSSVEATTMARREREPPWVPISGCGGVVQEQCWVQGFCSPGTYYIKIITH